MKLIIDPGALKERISELEALLNDRALTDALGRLEDVSFPGYPGAARDEYASLCGSFKTLIETIDSLIANSIAMFQDIEEKSAAANEYSEEGPKDA